MLNSLETKDHYNEMFLSKNMGKGMSYFIYFKENICISFLSSILYEYSHTSKILSFVLYLILVTLERGLNDIADHTLDNGNLFNFFALSNFSSSIKKNQ